MHIVKYTKAQEDELTAGYAASITHDERENYILKFMAKHAKSKRSIIAKLSKLSIYIARPKTSKVTGITPETKKQMVVKISLKLGMNPEELEGMDKAPKLALLNLLKRVEE